MINTRTAFESGLRVYSSTMTLVAVAGFLILGSATVCLSEDAVSGRSEETAKALKDLRHAILGVVSPDGRDAWFVKGRDNKQLVQGLAERVARDWNEKHGITNRFKNLHVHMMQFRSSEKVFDATISKGQKIGEYTVGKGYCEVSSLRTNTPTCLHDVGDSWHKTTCLHTTHCVWDSNSTTSCTSYYDTVWRTDWYKSSDGKPPCDTVAIDHTTYDSDNYCNP
jgi:hypothetical protein